MVAALSIMVLDDSGLRWFYKTFLFYVVLVSLVTSSPNGGKFSSFSLLWQKYPKSV